jgi:hypothetical protein
MLDKIKKAASETTDSLQDKVSNNLAKAKETTDSLQDKVTNNLKNELKPQIIKQATSINYSAISSALKLLDKMHSVPKSVIDSIDLLQNAANEYKQSDKPDRDDEFLNYLVNNVDAKLILTSIEPIVKLIPFGEIIVLLLKLIIKYK